VSLQLALVLIPESIPTELSVLGNTSGKISTTKLRKYPLVGLTQFLSPNIAQTLSVRGKKQYDY
jgi:hypothetical protein